MNKEEFKECSVVAYPRQIKFLHINGGAISYYVDRHVSDYVDRLQQENQELKKQLEELDKKLFFTKNELEMRQKSIDNKLNQQKEFIDYLEDLIKQNETVVEVSKYELPKNCSKLLIDFYKEILSKYKEIIGDK